MQLNKSLLAGLVVATSLAGCGGPTAQTSPPATLPATAEARDSAKAMLTMPARDAASTAADSTRSNVTPR